LSAFRTSVASAGASEDSNSKLVPDRVVGVIAGPQVKWTLVPEDTMKYASFRHEVEIVKAEPSSSKELCFAELHAVPGS